MDDALKNMTIKMSRIVQSKTLSGIFEELTDSLIENNSLVIVNDKFNFFNLCISIYGYKKTGSFELYDQLKSKIFNCTLIRPLEHGVSRECPICSGNGEFPCEYCDGNGIMECQDCGGLGEFAEETCGNCDGEGEVTCDECSDGYVRCGECYGHGDVYHHDIGEYKLISIVSFDEKLKQTCEYNLNTNNPIFTNPEKLVSFSFEDKSFIYENISDYGTIVNENMSPNDDYIYCCDVEDGLPSFNLTVNRYTPPFHNNSFIETDFYYEKYDN